MAQIGNRNAVGNRGNRHGRRGRNGTELNPELTRKKIQVAMLIRRLQDHIFDRLKKPLDTSQVRAIDILLKKCIPDLTTTVLTAELNVHYVAHLPEPISREAWLKKYGKDGDYLELSAANGSGESGNPAQQSVQKLQ